jgi:hypothetical protein
MEREEAMRNSYRKFLFIFLMTVFITICSSVSFAVTPQQPYLDYTGNFNYVQSTNALTFSSIVMSKVTYLDGTTESYSTSPLDPILGATINIGTLYNSASPGNLHFDDGSGGGVMFQISDGTYTYLTATLSPVDVNMPAGPFVPIANINPNLDLFNLSNIWINPLITNSKYLDELRTIGANGPNGVMNFNTSFTFYSGAPYNFTHDSNGQIQGLVTAPEPVSSVLFLSGGMLFWARRFKKRHSV